MKKIMFTLAFGLVWIMQVIAQAPNLLWAAAYGDVSEITFNQSADCTLDNSGNLFVVGYTKWYPHGDFLIIKYNTSNGDTIWTRTFNGRPGDIVNNNDIAMGCMADGSGNLFVTGMSSNSAGNTDILTIKYNGVTGDTIWTRRYNTVANGNDAGLECALDANGNLYIAGNRYNGSSTDFCILKYNASTGNLIWVNKYPSPLKNKGEAYGCSVSGSNVYINGYIYDGKSYHIYTVKCNANGDTLWTKINYEGLDSLKYIHSDCVADNQGNIYSVGNCSNAISGVYGTIIKYDASGNLLWSKKYENPPDNHLNDALYGCTLDLTGNLIVTGTTYGKDTFLNHFITLRYNAVTGDTIWTKLYSEGRSGMDCVVDAQGYLYITGAPNYWGCLTLKYDNSGMVGIALNNNSMGKNVYPNPATDKITIDMQNISDIQNTYISIYNIQGDLLIRQALRQNKTDIGIEGFAKGLYVVKISNNNIFVTKFLKY
jgi:hypothetical protein